MTTSDCSTSKTMIAFAIPNPGDKEGQVISLDIPTPGPNEALIKVLRAGVCNTDLEILQGYMGFSGVLGHEFVGRVVEVNSQDESLKTKWTNQRVCGDINVGCADCGVCANAFDLDACCPNLSRNHCPNRTVWGILKKNGTMAEYLTLPLDNLHAVPDGMDDATAVFAEPLAAACRIVEQKLITYGGPRPDKVAILGDGKLGLMIAEVLGREHAQRNNKEDAQKPVLFGKHPHKLELVKESGVDCRFVAECIDETSFSGVAAAHAQKYDVVVDATGSPAGLNLSAGMCRPMGTLVLKSTCAAGEKFNAAPFVIDELRVVGSRCGPIHTALDLLAIGINGAETKTDNNLPPLRVEKYVTKTYPLSQAVEAIQCAAEKSTMKVQIICSEEE